MDLTSRYSAPDRLLHKLSFATAKLQIELADLEDLLYGKALAAIQPRDPVFITALPRAGTTLLLQLAAALDEFASHSYRDMPFVLLPLLWNGISRNFQRPDVPTERAHGDGVLVSVDSAEAFEEMLWRVLWPDHYLADRIRPWSACDRKDAAAVLRNHFRKVVLLRRRNPEVVPRYLSKNNSNVSRIRALLECFPDATVIVPVREPLQHAASLVRTHTRLLAMQTRDEFAREYMEGIGHFDFGASLRPIDFAGWLDRAAYRDPATIAFWIEYWVAAHEVLREHRDDRVIVLAYDRFCAEPDKSIQLLAGLLRVEHRDALLRQAGSIRVPPVHTVDVSNVDPALVARAYEIHADLCKSAASAHQVR
jgi:hypothetical protein